MSRNPGIVMTFGVIAGLAVLAVPTGVLASSSDDSAPHLSKRLTDQNKEGSR